MMARKVTSADVARRAGVGQSAASRVFTPGASASAATAARVKKAAVELGYRPNMLARAMITGQSRIVGLVVAHLDNQLYPLAVEQSNRGLQAQGHHVILLAIGNETDVRPIVGDLMQVVGGDIGRYNDRVALAGAGDRMTVIAKDGVIREKPGFEVDVPTRANACEGRHSHDKPSVPMPVTGRRRIDWDGGSATLAPSDAMSLPKRLAHSTVPAMTGKASRSHVVATDDPAGQTWRG